MIDTDKTHKLPAPSYKSTLTVEDALLNRRSHRSFFSEALSIDHLSQILWAANGITEPANHNRFGGRLRTAPSAGTLYPLDIYVLLAQVDGIAPGVYKYLAKVHSIIKIKEGDMRQEICSAALDQKMIADAPFSLVFSSVFEKNSRLFGIKDENHFVFIELGHASQNVYLQAVSMNLGTCVIGAFDETDIKKIMALPKNTKPLYIMPVGKIKL